MTYRVEVRRSDELPAWNAYLYKAEGWSGDAWSDIRCCWTRWGARRAARKMLEQYIPVEVVRPE